MNILWNNSTKSGLCDRLLDITLMSAFGKYNNSDIYMKWKPFNSGKKLSWEYSKDEVRDLPNVRYDDCKYENFIKYFTLPNNIKVNEMPEGKYLTYSDYIGGIYSPLSFSKKMNLNYEKFKYFFLDSLSEIKATDMTIKISDKLKTPYLSVHLRRGDKIRNDDDRWSIRNNQLDDLNLKTFKVMDYFPYHDKHISTDDENEKNKYIEKYDIIEVPFFENEYEKTYIDLYLLSKSKYIIMSQVHSNFSLFGAMIGNSTLIEMFKDENRQDFSDIINIIYYKDLINNV
jgi:hypothetical protein